MSQAYGGVILSIMSQGYGGLLTVLLSQGSIITNYNDFEMFDMYE